MTEADREEQTTVSLIFTIPEGVVTRYATNIVVQHTEHEFIVSYFEAEVPMLLGSPEENLAKLTELGPVNARCVARVAVAPGRMADFIQVMQKNYDHYRARFGEEDK